jgi:hypothetical protein
MFNFKLGADNPTFVKHGGIDKVVLFYGVFSAFWIMYGVGRGCVNMMVGNKRSN